MSGMFMFGDVVLSRKNRSINRKANMKIQEITSTLEERGVIWQGFGFAAVGTASLGVLSIYSDSRNEIVETYRLAATQLNWAYIAIIALTIEGARKLFETKTEIRRKARQKAIAKAEARGEKRGEARGERRRADQIRTELRNQGVQLTPEQERAIFPSNGRKPFGFLPFFRK